MVHYTINREWESHQTPEEFFESRHFWKLGDRNLPSVKDAQDRLQAVSYHFSAGASKARLYQLLCRHERGLLSYEKYSVAELKQFCNRRGLQPNEDMKKKAELVVFMETADETSTFPRFLDLPPELRNWIYQLHFDTFKPLHRPTLPPLAKVSRHLYQETAKLFFQICTAKIKFKGEYRSSFHFGLGIQMQPPNGQEVLPLYLARELFAKATRDQLGNIRKLQVAGPAYHNGHPSSMIWDVNVGNANQPVYVSVGRRDRAQFPLAPGLVDSARNIKVELREEFELIKGREGINKLRANDLERLRLIFQNRCSQ